MMTERHNKLRYYGGGGGDGRLLYEDLSRFHMCVSAEDALDAARAQRWQDCASPQIRQDPGINLPMEAAWALLTRWEGLSSAEEGVVEGGAMRTLGQALLATLPPLTAWLRYVEQVPPGDAMKEYRDHRRETISRWAPHIHPDHSTFAAYDRDDSGLSDLVREGISAHLRGPYYCFTCGAQRAARSQGVAPPTRLAAAARASASYEHKASLEIQGEVHVFRVSFLMDNNFLRILATCESERALPRTGIRIAVVLNSGQIREGTFVYPDHSLMGINFGPIQGFSLDDVTGMSVEIGTA